MDNPFERFFCIIISITYFYKKIVMNYEPLDPGITIAIVLFIVLTCLFCLWVDKKNKI